MKDPILLAISKNLTFDGFVLEPIEERHAELLFNELQNDELYIYIPQRPPKSVSELSEKYLRWSHRKSKDNKEYWLNYVIFDNKINKYVGTLQVTVEASGKTYIAYEVFPKYQRHKVATRTIKYLINFIFNTFEVEQVNAHVDTRNVASYKLLESIGFVRIDRIKNADFFKGQNSDEFIYEFQKIL